MLSTLLYFAFVAAVGYYATTKGRSPIVWGLVAIIISPLIAAIILFFLKNLKEAAPVAITTAKPILNAPKAPEPEVKPEVKPEPETKPEPAPEAPKATPEVKAEPAAESQVPVAAVAAEPAPEAPKAEPVAEAPATNKCPYCDSELPAGAKFCGSCGAKL